MAYGIFSSLESAERPFFGPNYWLFQISGLILPQNKLGRMGWVMAHELIIWLVCSELLELSSSGNDVDLVLTNLRITMVSVICIIKSNVFVIWQDDWRTVIDYITEADKYERKTNDPVKLKIVEDYTRYCRKLSYSYWILMFLTFLSTITTPLVNYLSSSTYRISVNNGTEPFPHILSTWMPFDKNNFPGCWITVIYHIILDVYGALLLASYDTGVIVMMVFFGGKLDLMRIHCKEMFGTEEAMARDAEISSKIRELHQMYVGFLRHSRLFNSLQSRVMFFYVIVCSVMLCACAYQLTAATSAMQILVQVEYLIFGLSELFLFCWHSNEVMLKSEDVVLGPYESQWTGISRKHKKNIILLIGQLQNRLVYTAGPFTDLTVATFINVVKGAYSYYTLFRD